MERNRFSPDTVDLLQAAGEKLERNAAKYPVERVRGQARKYDEY